MININEICEKYINNRYIDFWNNDGEIIIDVTTGGASGGSCWNELDDEGAVEYEGYTGEEITGFEILKEILQSFEPDITDEKVNAILSDISSKEDTSVNEYYGNYTESYRVTIDLNKIEDEEIIFYLKMKEII